MVLPSLSFPVGFNRVRQPGSSLFFKIILQKELTESLEAKWGYFQISYRGL